MIYIQGVPLNTKGPLLTFLFKLRTVAVKQGPNASPEMIEFRKGITSMIAKMTNPNTQDQTFQEYLAGQEDWHF